MDFREVNLDELKIVGFIEINIQDSLNSNTLEIEYSSWGDSNDDLCPHCGEKHDLKTHNELNWEEQYPNHHYLKKNLDKLLVDSENIEVSDKKYEIVKFGENINDESLSYNMVGVRVKDLNKIPMNFIGMRFPAQKYISVATNIEEFIKSMELEHEVFEKYDLDDYFIIEYDLDSKVKFKQLKIKIYYPVKG